MATVKEIKEALAAIESLMTHAGKLMSQIVVQGSKRRFSSEKKLFKRILMKTYAWKYAALRKRTYQQGYQAIAGIDEVGRGPLAGPVVTACVILPKNCKIKHLNDSKKFLRSTMRKFIKKSLRVL